MFKLMSANIALAALMVVAPAPFGFDAADAGGKSRAASRTEASTGDVVQQASRGKSRRDVRGEIESDASDFAQTRVKKSRRNPTAALEEPTQLASAEAETPNLVEIATSEAAILLTHVQSRDFDGTTGALALYQLTGKAAADLPMSRVELETLASLMQGTDLSTLIKSAEDRLVKVAGAGISLEDIAEALGIPRPDRTVVSPNLGASLAIESAVNPG